MKKNLKKWFTLIEVLIVSTMLWLIAIWLSDMVKTINLSLKESEINRQLVTVSEKIHWSLESAIYNSKEIVYWWKTKCEWRFDWNFIVINELVKWPDKFVIDPEKSIMLCWDDWKLIAFWLVKRVIDETTSHYYLWKYKDRKITRISPIDWFTTEYRDSNWVNKELVDKILLWSKWWQNIWIKDLVFKYDWDLDVDSYLENLKKTAPKIKLNLTYEILFNKKLKYVNEEFFFIF